MKSRLKATLTLLLVASLFLFGCTSAPVTPATDLPADSTLEETKLPPAMDSAMEKGVIRYSKAAFDAAIASGKPVIVNVHANWCPICNAFAPIFNSTANQSTEMVFLKAHWKDEETNAEDEAFFAANGVSGQHTIIQFNPDEVKRSRESFTQETFNQWIKK